MLKTCKYCNIEVDYEKIQQFARHVSRCEKNPNLIKTRETLRENGKRRRKVREYVLNCKSCTKEYTVNITKEQFEKSDYKKHCSQNCSNKHDQKGVELNKKRRETLVSTLYSKSQYVDSSKIYYFNCKNIECSKLFVSKWDGEGNLKYCSKRCKNSCKDFKSKMSKLASSRFSLEPDKHPNRRCAQIKETYPEQYFRVFLEKEGFIKELDFIQQFCIRGEDRKCFVDFYIPSLKLCIEIDGEQWHDLESEVEIKRTKIIRQHYKLVRFWSKPLVSGKCNEDIYKIIDSIKQAGVA